MRNCCDRIIFSILTASNPEIVKKYYGLYLFSALVSVFLGCYSPKEKVEKDKHPDVPEFPKFKDDAVVLQLLTELGVDSGESCVFDKKGNKVFIYASNIESRDGKELDKPDFLLVLENGKQLRVANWEGWDGYDGETESLQVTDFFADNGDLYIGNLRFKAPSYKKQEKIKVVELGEIYKEFHDASPGEELEALAVQLQNKQAEVLGKVKSLREVYCGASTSKLLEEPRSSVYLCNEATSAPFYMDGNFFEDFVLNEKGEPTYEENKDYVNQFKSIVKGLKDENSFGSYDGFDQKTFKETEAIVIGNEWFSSGNHFVGSSGYSQIYLRYFDLKVGDEPAKTKVSEKNLMIPDVFKVSTGYYFLAKDAKQKKLTVYYLKG